ncbi:MAG TPA: pseudouridine synthase [Candidatus Limnocylindrales bacterium]|nr:pseudouridine synthase [Candidatus Limnocylindrales bacterium]
MAEGVRLQKLIAEAGLASRRGAEELIVAGRVAVDGVPASLGQRVDPTDARVTVDGRPIGTRAERLHLLLAKPAGVTSTVRDRHADHTVIEMVPAELRRRAQRLYPVGRLDRDSEGLLLLTNDGPWAEQVLHPRHGVEREYAVQLRAHLDSAQQRALLAGLELEEGRATPSGLRPLEASELRSLALSLRAGRLSGTWYGLVLGQGWKRQVRRMLGAVGAPVERLVRVRIGHLRLDGMRLGDIRELSDVEVGHLASSSKPAEEPA